MERLFDDRFYKPQPEISIAELMSLRQLPTKLITIFLERFSRVRSRCSVQLLESECATATFNNMHPQLRERLVAIEYLDLAQLSSRAFRVEQCIVEKEQRRSYRAGPKDRRWFLS